MINCDQWTDGPKQRKNPSQLEFGLPVPLLKVLSSREGFAVTLECLGRSSEALSRVLVSYTIIFNFGLFGIGESTSSLDRFAELIMGVCGNTGEFVFPGCKWLDVSWDRNLELRELSMRKHGAKSRSYP
jgi:hypothetical protein